MKRSLIFVILLIFCFGNVFAQYEDCIDQNKIPMWIDRYEYECVNYEEIPEWSNKEIMYENVIRLIMKEGPSSYYYKGSFFNWRTEYEEAIRYYIENFVINEEEKDIMVEFLFLENLWSILTIFDKVTIFDWDINEVIRVGENAIDDLNKYGKTNENYDFYLGRYSFFLGMLYYYDGNYKKALEYITIAHNNYKANFK